MPADTVTHLSVLDLSPVASGSSASEALRNTLDLARHVDKLGYRRYWMSEHHNTAMLASAVPEVLVGHVANVTNRIRVGSGGIMLPNHAPLKVAETFRLLEALHPGRIDLGLGRAPGTDGLAALALRRSREALRADDFPEQLAELLGFFTGEFPDEHPFSHIVAIPQGVATPELWLLGSSDFSARLAAEWGLGFAFAHHINPTPAVESLRIYHERFKPSEYLAEPKALLAVSVICAETEEKADILASSADLALRRFHQNIRQPVPSVAEALAYAYTPYERELVQSNRSRFFVGSPVRTHERLSRLASQCGVEEIMITSLIHAHEARLHSYTLLAQAFGLAQNL